MRFQHYVSDNKRPLYIWTVISDIQIRRWLWDRTDLLKYSVARHTICQPRRSFYFIFWYHLILWKIGCLIKYLWVMTPSGMWATRCFFCWLMQSVVLCLHGYYMWYAVFRMSLFRWGKSRRLIPQQCTLLVMMTNVHHFLVSHLGFWGTIKSFGSTPIIQIHHHMKNSDLER